MYTEEMIKQMSAIEIDKKLTYDSKSFFAALGDNKSTIYLVFEKASRHILEDQLLKHRQFFLSSSAFSASRQCFITYYEGNASKLTHATTYYIYANELMSKYDFDRALMSFKSALETVSTSDHTFKYNIQTGIFDLGEKYLASGNIERARECFIISKLQRSTAHYKLALAFANKANVDEAAKYYLSDSVTANNEFMSITQEQFDTLPDIIQWIHYGYVPDSLKIRFQYDTHFKVEVLEKLESSAKSGSVIASCALIDNIIAHTNELPTPEELSKAIKHFENIFELNWKDSNSHFTRHKLISFLHCFLQLLAKPVIDVQSKRDIATIIANHYRLAKFNRDQLKVLKDYSDKAKIEYKSRFSSIVGDLANTVISMWKVDSKPRTAHEMEMSSMKTFRQ